MSVRRVRAALARRLAAFDAWVDGLDVYGPGSRVHEREEGVDRWRRGG